MTTEHARFAVMKLSIDAAGVPGTVVHVTSQAGARLELLVYTIADDGEEGLR